MEKNSVIIITLGRVWDSEKILMKFAPVILVDFIKEEFKKKETVKSIVSKMEELSGSWKGLHREFSMYLEIEKGRITVDTNDRQAGALLVLSLYKDTTIKEMILSAVEMLSAAIDDIAHNKK